MPHEEDYQNPESIEEIVPEEESPSESEFEASALDELEDSNAEDSTEISEEERHQQHKAIAEALIFATNEPLTESQFLTVVGRRSRGKLSELVEELNTEYVHQGRAFEILHVAKGYQYFTRPEYAHSLKKLFTERSRTRLSRAALESLAVIAFRGPVTRSEIDEIRGVESSGVLRTLLDRRLIMVKGRAEVIGRPMLYETTEEFLRHFGLSGLDDLPKHHELTREWGELQEAKREIESETREQDDTQTDRNEARNGESPENSGKENPPINDRIGEPDGPGDENGHTELATVDLGNKPIDSEQ